MSESTELVEAGVVEATTAVIAEKTTEIADKTTAIADKTTEIAEQVGVYGFVVLDSLYMIVAGMVIIFLLHKFAYKFIFTHLSNPRVARVIFGAIYTVIFLMAVLLSLRGLGFDVRVISKISILIVLVGAVAIFYLSPFLPRLPFMLGHLVEINGVTGIVDAISTYHTTIRCFDGTMVFVPNALVMALKIKNYSDTATRRIEMNLRIKLSCDLEETQALLLRIVNADDRVLPEPVVPSIVVMGADGQAVDMTIYCWVANTDWLVARSDLWLKVLAAIDTEERVTMVIPQQEIYLQENAKSV